MLLLAHPGLARENQNQADATELVNSINLNWWNNFNDPILVNYINQAINSNKDLKIAALDIQKQRAKVREVFAKELPNLNMLGNFIRFRPDGVVHQGVIYQNFFTGAFAPAYEIDLLQKNRRKTKAQEQILEGERQDARAVYIAIAADVASAYINILSLDKSIIFQEEVVNLDGQAFFIRQAKYNAGLVSYSDVIEAETALKDSEILLTELERTKKVFLNQLAALTGLCPEGSECLPRGDFNNLRLNLPANLVISSEKIMLRPDILKAEALIKRAKLDVEFIRRDFLPNLNVYGILGFNTLDLTNLPNARKYLTVIGAGVFHSLFPGGARFARLRGAKYDYEQLLADYQQTILTSLQEVNDNLVYLKSDLKISSDIDEKLRATEQHLYLVNVKYETGLISCLDTLEDKKDVLLLSQDSIQSRATYFFDYINLYKTLAGNI